MAIKVRHVGKLGDIVYAMAAMRGLCMTTRERVDVVLNRFRGSRDRPNQWNEWLTRDEAESIKTLLDSQKGYIAHVDIEDEPPPDAEEEFVDVSYEPWVSNRLLELDNLARSACHFSRIDARFAGDKWLEVTAERDAAVYVAWTGRYPNKSQAALWQAIADEIPDDAVFIGTPTDKKIFEVELIGKELAPRAEWFHDFNDAAKKIAGCDLLYASQTSMLAIAHGLGKPVVVETSSRFPDCIFLRPNAHYMGLLDHLRTRCGVRCAYAEELGAAPSINDSPSSEHS